MTDTQEIVRRLEAGYCFELYDQHGIPVAVGDIIKVFHFTAALRRKKHYMYKQVMGLRMIGQNKDVPYVSLSHLDMTDEDYLEKPDGRIMRDWQIVQSVKCDHDKRQRRSPAFLAALLKAEG